MTGWKIEYKTVNADGVTIWQPLGQLYAEQEKAETIATMFRADGDTVRVMRSYSVC